MLLTPWSLLLVAVVVVGGERRLERVARSIWRLVCWCISLWESCQGLFSGRLSLCDGRGGAGGVVGREGGRMEGRTWGGEEWMEAYRE